MPVNEHDQVLLLRGCDPAQPAKHYWFTVGGGVEPGESLPEAAVRELLEETGVGVAAAELGEPFHVGQHEFTYDGRHYVNDSTFYALRVPRDVRLSLDGLEDGEVGNVFEVRWVGLGELDRLPLSNDQLTHICALAVERVTAG